MRSRKSLSGTVCLVACCKKKRSGRARPAEELYDSTLFRLSRAFARANAEEWFILSALHGLLDPRREIKPYNRSLYQLDRSARRQWADGVYAELIKRLSPEKEILLLAGQRYREDLGAMLASAGYSVRVPLAGKRLGEQLQWLKRNTGQ